MSFIDEAKHLISDGEIKDETTDFLADTIDALLGNPVSAGKVIIALAKTPFLFREKMLWVKLEQFLNGVYESDDDRAKLCAWLVDGSSNNDYSKRLIECIDRAETSQKVQYLINATRCLLAGFVNRTTYFRICRAISGTIDEDLLFLRDHIHEDNLKYDNAIQGLLISGLVTFSVIGGEETLYSFTPLAKLVDQFAVSYDDVARYPNPTASNLLPAPNVTIPTVTEEDIDEMVNGVFGETADPKVEVQIPFGDF